MYRQYIVRRDRGTQANRNRNNSENLCVASKFTDFNVDKHAMFIYIFSMLQLFAYTGARTIPHHPLTTTS